jgi:hypothetical protein
MTSLERAGGIKDTPHDTSPTSNNRIDLDMAGKTRSKTKVSGQPNPSNRRQIWLTGSVRHFDFFIIQHLNSSFNTMA